MTGFRAVLPELVTWLDQGVSGLKGSSLDISSQRLCHFSAQFAGNGGLGNCSPGLALRGYVTQGNTNIHQAIRASESYDLTAILTDGVAAAGGSGSGDCAGGVDAACVARSLLEVIRSIPQSGVKPDWGVWILPIVAPFNGSYYAEVQGTATPDVRAISEGVKSDFGEQLRIEPVVRNPRNDKKGNQEFDYFGPRTLMLIVVAQQAEIGRTYLQDIWQRAGGLRLGNIEKLQDFSEGIAIAKPVELYPGYSSPQNWKLIQQPDDPSRQSGTIDVRLTNTKDVAEFRLSCTADSPGQAEYSVSDDAPKRKSGCVPILQLPAVKHEFQPARQSDAGEIEQFVAGFKSGDGENDQTKLCLRCDLGKPRNCAGNDLSAAWVAEFDYGLAADAFQSKDRGLAHTVLDTFVTSSPIDQPHRVFGLNEVLERFNRELRGEKKPRILQRVRFCHQVQ